jgi:hypothetical protein
MKFFIYGDNNVPARRKGADIPELFVGGKFKLFYDLFTFDHNSKEITEEEFKHLVSEKKAA